MKRVVFTALMLAITVAAFVQASKKSEPIALKGVCSHPAVNDGAPFPIGDSTLDGSNLTRTNEEGQTLTLVGAQCILVRDKK